jgi:hypothetical protein
MKQIKGRKSSIDTILWTFIFNSYRIFSNEIEKIRIHKENPKQQN